MYAEKKSVVFHNNIFVLFVFFSIDRKLDVKIEGDIEAAQSMKSTPELFVEVGKYLSEGENNSVDTPLVCKIH